MVDFLLLLLPLFCYALTSLQCLQMTRNNIGRGWDLEWNVLHVLDYQMTQIRMHAKCNTTTRCVSMIKLLMVHARVLSQPVFLKSNNLGPLM